MAILRHLVLAVFSCMVLITGPAYAEGYPEYQLKAAFLYNFLSFVEWPASAASEKQAEVSICVLGADPFGVDLDALKGRLVGGKTVTVKRLKSAEELKGCHSVFIGDSEGAALDRAVKYSRQYSVLTVSDMDGFLDRGGMIQFVLRDKKIRFRINLDAAERARLKVSSKLMRVAI